jgi:DNA primase
LILLDVLDSSGQEYKRTGKKGEVRAQCPFCIEKGMVAQDACLGINVGSGVGHCFRCGWSSDGLKRSVEELCRATGLDAGLFRVQRREVREALVEEEEKELLPTGYPDEYERFAKLDDPVEKQAWLYLKDRGVTWKQVKKHRIGFAAVGRLSYRVIFPVVGRDEQVYGAVGRDFTGEQQPKYLNTPGMKMLWGGEQEQARAVVTEGIMDALSAERALGAYGFACLARLGSAITELQLKQLSHYKKVIILPDWDKAGVLAALRLGKEAKDYGIAIGVSIPSVLDGRDPGSMGEKEIQQWVEKAQEWGQGARWRLRAVMNRRG